MIFRKFPATRLRRTRSADFIRKMLAETSISVNDLIYPVFVLDGKKQREAVPSMPDIERVSIDYLLHDLETVVISGIPAVALFPVISQDKKTLYAEESYNENGLVQCAVGFVRHAVFP